MSPGKAASISAPTPRSAAGSIRWRANRATSRSRRGDAMSFVEDFRKNAAKLQAAGLYDPAEEHDACGVGFVAALDGKPRREVVEAGINALKAVWHRGAVDAD